MKLLWAHLLHFLGWHAAAGSRLRGESAGAWSADRGRRGAHGAEALLDAAAWGRGAGRGILDSARGGMDIDEAMHRLGGKLPDDVAGLLGLARGDPEYPRSEESLQKARAVLNEMVQASWADLDSVMMECKEFQERNRETFQQVGNDKKRIASQMSEYSRRDIRASGDLASLDRSWKDAVEMKRCIELRCRDESLRKSAELQVKQNGLAVFEFVLEVTRCSEDGASLLQRNSSSVPEARVCGTEGRLELRLGDPRKQAKLDSMLTRESREALRRALREMATLRTALPQLRAARACACPGQEPVPVQAGPPLADQSKRCIVGEADCGLLHDTMALEWGNQRDLVDELKAELLKDSATCRSELANLNDQLTLVGQKKGDMAALLAEAKSELLAGYREMSEKEEQYRELEEVFQRRTRECKSSIEEILYTNICAVKKVRDSLMMNSTESPVEAIADCDVEDWSVGSCSVDCDDTCPQDDPYKCGGWQQLTRAVVVPNNSYGIQCPALAMHKRCNQFSCSVDCETSEWSGWSGCSSDCGGGEQQRTRAVLTKPRNGGQECDSTLEARACNTGSCDRDCTLSDWSEWSGCSTACGGGEQQRARSVLVPIRALGKCPCEDNPERLERRTCNEADCVGDEVCAAKQDLVLAIDGSGSLREDGFDTVRRLAASLIGRYQSMFQGRDAMRVGVVVFGQGALEADGSVAGAEEVQGLTAHLDSARAAVEGLAWQRGFTNLAQAFSLASRVLREGGRADAQSAVLVLSDGRPAMKLAAAHQATKLKEGGTLIYMVPVAEYPGEDLDPLKQWASQPWETSYQRIPGVSALRSNFDAFVSKLVAKFCPMSVSPAMLKRQAEELGYMLIHKGGYPNGACARYAALGKYVGPGDCYKAAKENGFGAFSWTHAGRLQGSCSGEHVEVTASLWDSWLANSTDPECPKGSWKDSPFDDTYALDPAGLDVGLDS